MGKVHRIKKSFRKIVSQQPVQAGVHSLGKTVGIQLARNYSGRLYAQVVSGRHYEKLAQSLMREYNERAV